MKSYINAYTIQLKVPQMLQYMGDNYILEGVLKVKLAGNIFLHHFHVDTNHFAVIQISTFSIQTQTC